MDIKGFLKKTWWIFALLAIILFSYHIRAYNIVPDKLLDFDPIFQYRYTSYLANYGNLPLWDELTYYTGRAMTFHSSPPLMFYATVALFEVLKGFGMSLMTVCSYASAIYGALIALSAFLLGRELSNKYGGLFAAALVGTAPQILIRTFGGSYDTDQIVLFFVVLTIYLGIYALRKKTIASYSLALAGFFAFMLAWNSYLYSYVIMIAGLAMYLLINFLDKKGSQHPGDMSKRFVEQIKNISAEIKFLILLTVGLITLGFINGINFFSDMSDLFGFVVSAEQWIVNISIAELQPFSITNLDGWLLATGRFITGNNYIDIGILIAFIGFIAAGLWFGRKGNKLSFAFMLTLFLVAIYTTFRGIRFTEFTAALTLTLAGAGFGILVEKFKEDKMIKSLTIGLAIFIVLVGFSISADMGHQLGPGSDPNWSNAWNFLSTQTPELSVVGTWWDPGHMIAGIADRRNIADGAHCHTQCLYTINDRIVDLGKVMATTNETLSLETIKKYKGDAPKVYWIASDDLIGKFRWVQYFGLGCDGTSDPKCPLYYQISASNQTSLSDGSRVISYSNIMVLFKNNTIVPIYVDNGRGALFKRFIFYTEPNKTAEIELDDNAANELVNMVTPEQKELGIKMTNQTLDLTLWLPSTMSYAVIIPKSLEDAVFTKMFMKEGEGLTGFKEVYRNEAVKIFEVTGV